MLQAVPSKALTFNHLTRRCLVIAAFWTCKFLKGVVSIHRPHSSSSSSVHVDSYPARSDVIHVLLSCSRGSSPIQRDSSALDCANRCACPHLLCRRRHRARNWGSRCLIPHQLLIPSKCSSILGLDLCQTCLSRLLRSKKDRTVLGSVDAAAAALPSSPSIGDRFSRKSSTDFGSSARSLVLMALHHPFLFLFLRQWPFPLLVQILQHPSDRPFPTWASLGATCPLAAAKRTTSSLSSWYVSSRDR